MRYAFILPYYLITLLPYYLITLLPYYLDLVLLLDKIKNRIKEFFNIIFILTKSS
ncbi:MAG: hypothetical protein ACTS7E_02045 [Arsenophonus sp. NC-CH8-MAG3]